MSVEQDQVYRQVREAARENVNSETFYQALRQALTFGPLPRELAQEIWKQRATVAETPHKTRLLPQDKEPALREALSRHHEPSARAQDPNHPVGAVAAAMRAALPEFRSWQVDMAAVDLNQAAAQMAEDRTKALSYLFPPDFPEARADSYITAERGVLVRDADGSVLTMSELLRKKATQEAFAAQTKEGCRFSDCLSLLWKRLEPIDLRSIEQRLWHLAELMAAGTPVWFRRHEDHYYQSALRMELGDSPIPAAIGGVCGASSRLPEGVHAAAVTIYLEPWASARSGAFIDLAEESPFLAFGGS